MSNVHKELMRQKIEKAEQKQREHGLRPPLKKEQREQEKAQRRTENRRFRIQTALAVVAAVSGLLGFLLSFQW
ncbi:MAG: hypothetical protein V8T45_07360 [Oscillospiraceae bacterium]